MYYPEGDSVIGRSLELYGEWAEHEIDVISRLLVDGETILDVGANIGTHAIAFSRRFPNAGVYSFEPQPLAFKLLAANLVENGVRNCTPLNFACGERRQIISVRFDYSAIGYNSGAFAVAQARIPQKNGGFPLMIFPIDRLEFPTRVQFIKIDVEGMEGAVLRGAVNVLKVSRPIVFLEVLSIAALQEPRELLRQSGYDLYWLETWAFNHSNYKRNNQNIWSRCEMAALAVPAERAIDIDLPPISGSEMEVPYLLDPRVGYNVIDTSITT